jgi:hypothetical protein
MPNQSYTVSPVIQEGEGGSHIVGASVSSTHSVVGRDGQVRGWESDYVENEVGQTVHRFSQAELESDSPSTFNDDEYTSALLEAHPQLGEAIQWAATNLPSELSEDFNDKVNSGDLEKVNNAVEWLLGHYNEHAGEALLNENPTADEEEESGFEDQLQDLSDQEVEALNEAVESLESQEPEGDMVAAQWQDYVEDALNSGDETFATVAAATAAFHSGEVSADEAISHCLTTCNLKELSRVYKALQG